LLNLITKQEKSSDFNWEKIEDQQSYAQRKPYASLKILFDFSAHTRNKGVT
jgi:hypothetical protein